MTHASTPPRCRTSPIALGAALLLAGAHAAPRAQASPLDSGPKACRDETAAAGSDSPLSDAALSLSPLWAPQDPSWRSRTEPAPSGGKFFIRIYRFKDTEVASARLPSNPNPFIEDDGVRAAALRFTPAALCLGFDPPATPPPSPPSTTPAPAPSTPPPAPPTAPPSLDDLLGTKPAKPAPAPSPTPDKPAPDVDPSRGDLDRLLKGEEIGEAFTAAVGLMDDAAKRLEKAKDAGLDTQRVQEDVVRRLDQLLASLQKRQSSSSSSSSSSSQSQQDQQSQRNQPNQPQPQKGQKSAASQANQGEGERRDLGPARQDGQLRPALDAARAAWGSLPERVRDMLLQGSSDRFSAKYQAMTEAYYKKLAEEKK